MKQVGHVNQLCNLDLERSYGTVSHYQWWAL